MPDNSAPSQSDSTSADAADASSFVQTNLISDLSGLAPVTDANLVNPWGVSFNATTGSPFWISDQGSNVATVYPVTGSAGVAPAALTVHIPTTASGPQGPTGQVANTNASSFILGDGKAAHFIFADLNGTISAWDSGSTASVEWTTPGAVYTGLAVNTADTMLYAANDSAGTIDVFNSTFTPVSLGADAFKTPDAIADRGLVPFNVTDIGGNVYVTYAPAGHTAQTTAGLGDGAVAVFTESGKLEPHGVLLGGPHTPLASPWGVAIAPSDFGKFSGDLLVGNFSYLHSEINAFDPRTHKLVGTIPISVGSGNTPGGLWDLTFGGGGKDGSPSTLYFTDGIDGETHGLFGAITAVPQPSSGQEFSQSNLVSDAQPGHLNASIQDPNLINPWGVAFGSNTPFWVNNNHTGTATIYNVDPKTNAITAAPLVVTIAPPQAMSGVTTASPTGIVFNSDQNGFMLNGKPATFIMDTEDGTISAWNGGTMTTLEVDNSANAALGDPNVPPDEGIGAVYKGLAIGTQKDGTTLLYATNFRHGTVDVFNSQFQQVNSLTDGDLPAGYAPFNAQVLDGHLFVSYALQDQFKHDDVAGAGNGFVDEFSLSGKLIARVASNGPLDSPWGMAIAPHDFGKFAGDLLVGNFGDGTINAFNLKTDKFDGTLDGVDGKPITIGDLWALTPGNGAKAGSQGEIFFTAGVQAESAGLFGAIAPVPSHNNEFQIVGGNNNMSTARLGQMMAGFGAENPSMGTTATNAPASTTTTADLLAPPAAHA